MNITIDRSRSHAVPEPRLDLANMKIFVGLCAIGTSIAYKIVRLAHITGGQLVLSNHAFQLAQVAVRGIAKELMVYGPHLYCFRTNPCKMEFSD